MQEVEDRHLCAYLRVYLLTNLQLLNLYSKGTCSIVVENSQFSQPATTTTFLSAK